MALQNIGAGNCDDAFYRYKMPKTITNIEGQGNGIKTNIVNMVDIAKALARPASYTMKYFGYELGAQSKFDEKTRTSLVNRAHDTTKLAALLEIFIKKYVQCHGCGNPEIEILITKTQMVQFKCAACGFVSDVDIRDKLTSFILKNPPEANKGRDKKAMRRAKKERLKEGEAIDEEQKKLKKEAAKQKKSSKDGASKGASTKDLMGITHPPEIRQKIILQKVVDTLFKALFDGVENGFAKEVSKKKNYLVAALAYAEGSQMVLLRSIESFCVKAGTDVVKEVALAVKNLYEPDVLEEEAIVEWYEKGSAGTNKGSPALIIMLLSSCGLDGLFAKSFSEPTRATSRGT
ncbi:hypothetical protein Cgig2_029519 [Carnegiea gigantea]|uniref:W2 domain-containing protein n=1 Tax=Carnegiea gigantea TaxID=171969 RepID=A0A9Q1KKY9_9CARY|nr:hypothetical protein Cgig2_029519 [Carnegiea gigantea]